MALLNTGSNNMNQIQQPSMEMMMQKNQQTATSQMKFLNLNKNSNVEKDTQKSGMDSGRRIKITRDFNQDPE